MVYERVEPPAGISAVTPTLALPLAAIFPPGLYVSTSARKLRGRMRRQSTRPVPRPSQHLIESFPWPAQFLTLTTDATARLPCVDWEMAERDERPTILCMSSMDVYREHHARTYQALQPAPPNGNHPVTCIHG